MNMINIRTLCIILKENQILLGLKKHGFGKGRWNGFGGKLEQSESPEQCIIREIKEESGLTALEVEERGIIEFEYPQDPGQITVHLFVCSNFEGEIVETEEMIPGWFLIDEIPYKEMWPDDIHWLSKVIEGKSISAKYCYNKNGEIDFGETNTY